MMPEEEAIENELLKLPKETVDELYIILGDAFIKALKFSFDAIIV